MRHYARRFPGTPEAIAATRRWTRTVLAELDCDETAVETAELIISELSTNAVRYSVSGLPGGSYRAAVAPLFGAPTIADSTRHFLAALTTVIPAKRLTLCVDDLTPRFLYRDPGDIGATYRSLAADLGCGVRLLSEPGPDDLSERLATILARLSGADLVGVVPRGTLARLRGGLTGYDAVHLAVIAACLRTGPQPGLVATKGANLAALHRLARFTTATGVLVCTGHDYASPGDTPRLVVEDASLLSALRLKEP